ncbi:uncharacterized protein LOC117176697 [Belonocnema kinseyi]|uniref:uncharacterized protein LOC117176697 n=1 Tax=Belonocnema kinseyi TaxID=2817044 RepID=UPI00143DC2D3|nr:uncharacterized protein LOC117176697 [Belonocnema kinseyi]
MRSLLLEMKFKYKKLNQRPVLMESFTVAGKRAEFLRKIEEYRHNNWNIFYQDETWCGANHSLKRGWLEHVQKKNTDNYDYYRGHVQHYGGYQGGFVNPSGAGLRIIISHIGSKDGFLEDCMLCFIGKKGNQDYHQEKNKQHFEEWFRKVLRKIPTKSVIVVDQAPYHTMLDPEFRNPTLAWKKASIIEWVQKRKIPLPVGVEAHEMLTIRDLLNMTKPYRYPKC